MLGDKDRQRRINSYISKEGVRKKKSLELARMYTNTSTYGFAIQYGLAFLLQLEAFYSIPNTYTYAQLKILKWKMKYSIKNVNTF